MRSASVIIDNYLNDVANKSIYLFLVIATNDLSLNGGRLKLSPAGPAFQDGKDNLLGYHGLPHSGHSVFRRMWT